MAVYLDSSALVKLVVEEAESPSLRRYLRRRVPRVSSAIARVELLRAVRDDGAEASSRAERLLAGLRLVRLDDDLLHEAARLDPRVLRSLDAIHLSCARRLGRDLESLVTYDARMRQAALLLRIPVESPGPRH